LCCFFKRIIAQKIQRDTQGHKIVPLTNLPQLSFAEREIDYLPYWVCISVAVKNDYKGKNTAADVCAAEQGILTGKEQQTRGGNE
jgi:hypothetical protein